MDAGGRTRGPAFGDLDGDGDLDLVVGESNGVLNYYVNGYCTTSCSGRGVCNVTDNLFPTCDCLTGFAGDQCNECQTGYFGSACDLCREGGNETKTAPRIADTCGVAWSGRSRGLCDDGFTGSGNCACFPNFAGDDCSEGGCPAGTIESAKQNGAFYEAFCEPCPPGTYQGLVGDRPTCIKCPAPSTTASAGATGCYMCSAGSYFSPFAEGSVRCDDPVELEAQCRDDDTACFDKCCLPCRRGMDCTNSTTNTLQDVTIADGWWRNTLFSDKIYRCEYEDSCEGGRCSEGHEGVACRVCKAGFYHSAVESKCLECGSLHAHPLAIATGICLIVLMIGSICVFRRRRPEAFAKATRAAEKTLRALATDAGSEDVDVIDGGSAQTAALSGAQDGLDNYEDACEAATGALPEEDAEEDEEKANFMRSVQTKLKILLAVIQIQNALPWTLPFVSYPEPFEALVAWMSFIELDFVRIVPMSCMMSYSFFDTLLASTLFPLILAAIILGAGKTSSRLRRDPADQRAAWIYAHSWFLLLTYVVFTGTSTTVLRFFNCVDYESVDATGRSTKLRVLQADHSISCDSPSYKKWTGYAVIMLFVYPVGIPMLYLCELLRHRKGINPDLDSGVPNKASDAPGGAPPASDAPPPAAGGLPPGPPLTHKEAQQRKIEVRSGDESIAHLAFLFAEYEPRCYLFIVFECLRRLALTGMLIFIFPGSPSQIVIGLFVAVFSQGVTTAASPYVDASDENVAIVGQFQIVLIFIASFVLLVKDMPEQDGAAGDLWRGPAFAVFMVTIGVLTLLMVAYTLIIDSILMQRMLARWARGRRMDRVKPVEAPAEAPAPSPAPAPCVAEAPVPAASTVEAEAPAAPDKQRCRAPPSLGVSPSGQQPRAVIRRGEPRDPIARPLHAGPPSRRPPPLYSGRPLRPPPSL